jgi:hypothetical protein
LQPWRETPARIPPIAATTALLNARRSKFFMTAEFLSTRADGAAARLNDGCHSDALPGSRSTSNRSPHPKKLGCRAVSDPASSRSIVRRNPYPVPTFSERSTSPGNLSYDLRRAGWDPGPPRGRRQLRDRSAAGVLYSRNEGGVLPQEKLKVLMTPIDHTEPDPRVSARLAAARERELAADQVGRSGCGKAVDISWMIGSVLHSADLESSQPGRSGYRSCRIL